MATESHFLMKAWSWVTRTSTTSLHSGLGPVASGSFFTDLRVASLDDQTLRKYGVTEEETRLIRETVGRWYKPGASANEKTQLQPGMDRVMGIVERLNQQGASIALRIEAEADERAFGKLSVDDFAVQAAESLRRQDVVGKDLAGKLTEKELAILSAHQENVAKLRQVPPERREGLSAEYENTKVQAAQVMQKYSELAPRDAASGRTPSMDLLLVRASQEKPAVDLMQTDLDGVAREALRVKRVMDRNQRQQQAVTEANASEMAYYARLEKGILKTANFIPGGVVATAVVEEVASTGALGRNAGTGEYSTGVGNKILGAGIKAVRGDFEAAKEKLADASLLEDVADFVPIPGTGAVAKLAGKAGNKVFGKIGRVVAQEVTGVAADVAKDFGTDALAESVGNPTVREVLATADPASEPMPGRATGPLAGPTPSADAAAVKMAFDAGRNLLAASGLGMAARMLGFGRPSAAELARPAQEREAAFQAALAAKLAPVPAEDLGRLAPMLAQARPPVGPGKERGGLG